VNTILIGFKSTGKTTLGKIIAEKFKRKFIDIDDEIAKIYLQKYGEKITARQIYLKLGDAGYRALEKEVIFSLGDLDNTIIATGGGSVCDPENAKVLGYNGNFIYLDTPKEIIQKRIAEDPTLKFLDLKHPARNFEQTFAIRQMIYQELADLIIKPEDKTTKEIVEIIGESFYGK